MAKRLLLLSVLLAGCSGKPRTLRLGIAAQQSISQMPAYLAQQLGYFAEEGVPVTIEEFPGASKGMEALLGGSVDVVSGYYDQTIQVAAEGRHVQAFAIVFRSLMIALAVSPKASRKIESVADLKGATVGVTTLGASTHLLLNYLLEKNGLKAEDVKPVAIGTAARAVAAMERGIVDAGAVSDFTVLHLSRRFGAVKLLADTRTPEGVLATYGVTAFPSTAIYAQLEWIQQNPETAKRLVNALRRTMRWIEQHTPEEIAAKMPASHHGEDEGIYVETIRHGVPLLNPDLSMPAGGPELVQRVLGLSKIDLTETYTDRFLKQ